MPGTGGCNFAEDPALDAREARPCWLPTPAAVAQLEEGAQVSGGAAFSLWKIPGRKSLFHNRCDLHLSAQVSHETVRVLIPQMVCDGGTFAFRLPASSDLHAAWAAASRAFSVLTARYHPARSSRPNRQVLSHARSLQALDGEAGGASQREIAEVLFGEREVWERWGTNSELRAQLRYLLRRGHQLVDGGYRRLLYRENS